MSLVTSGILLAATFCLFWKYRPRESTSRELCAICGLMAVITPLAPGGTWFLQAVSIATKAVALLCCYFQLRREARRRNDGRRPRRNAPPAEQPDLHLPAA